MWLFFALLAPFFFGIVHIIDSHCVNNVLQKPWFGAFTSSITTALVLLILIPYCIPFVELNYPGTKTVIMGLLAGLLIQFSQYLYFQSLSYSETGIVAAYWNMIPLFLPFLGFFLLGQQLSFIQYITIFILIITSTNMIMLDVNLDKRFLSFGLMVIACLAQAFAYLLQDVAFETTSFAVGFLFLSLGIIAGGITPILLKSCRRKLLKSSKQLFRAGKLLLIAEFVNVAALLSAQFGIYLGNPSLVAAVETTIPAYVFIISSALLIFKPKLVDRSTMKNLFPKLSMVSLMTLSMFLIVH